MEINNQQKMVKLFYCYDHKDKTLRDELAMHVEQRLIAGWHYQDITPGEVWQKKINHSLNSADVILLIVSIDFIRSKDAEIKRAMERHNAQEACVIPINMRSANWKGTRFEGLAPLPPKGEPPITSSEGYAREIILVEVAASIHSIAEKLLNKWGQDKKDHIALGDARMGKKDYTAAVAEYKRAEKILPPHDVSFYRKLGMALIQVGELQEAYIIFEQAIGLAPNDADLHRKLGEILMQMREWSKAVNAFKQATSLAPNEADLYYKLGKAYKQIRDWSNALEAFEHTINLVPEIADPYAEKGIILYSQNKYQQALDAYQKAVERDNQNIQFHRWKCQALVALQRFEEARDVYSEIIHNDQSNPLLYKEYGDILVNLAQFDEAHTTYNKAIALDENYVSAYEARCILFKLKAKQAELIAKQAYEDYNKYTKLANDDDVKVQKLNENHG